MSVRSKLLLAGAVWAIMAAGYACGSAEPSPSPKAATPAVTQLPTPTPTPVNPLALLRQSGRVMEELESFHFHLEHKSGGTPLPFLAGLVLKEADGDVLKPDKLSVTFGGTLGMGYFKSSLITVGEESYMTNPLTGQWERIPAEVSPLGFFDPRRGIASMMSRMDSVILTASGGGRYRLMGRLPAEALGSLLGETVRGETASVEITMDSDDLFLLEAVVDGKVTPEEPDGTVRVITLSRFGERFEIEPPR